MNSSKISVLDSFRVLYQASTTKSTIFFILVLVFALGEVVMGSISGFLPSKLLGFINAQDIENFKKTLLKYTVYLVGSVFCVTVKLFFSDWLAVFFRKTLVSKLHERFMAGNSFYELLLYNAEIDNPDARITDDIKNYCTSFIQTLVGLAQAPTLILYYSFMTFKDMGVKMLLIFVCFTVFSFILTRVVMNPIIKLTYAFEAANGDFRLAHVNLKENAETIALSKGQSQEKKLLSQRLKSVLEVQTKLANRSIIMNVIANMCQYFGTALVYICIYICRPKENIAEYTSRVIFEVIEVMYGITLFMQIITEYSKLCGYSTRIKELFAVLSEHRDLVLGAECGEDFVVENATIVKPNDEVLVRNLSFTLKKGDSLFISGPSGSGKSSIFRCLGHIWPVKEGSITTPECVPSNVMLLTQYPYLPVITTLDDCIAFPLKANEVDREEIEAAKRLLRIEHLNLRDQEQWFNGLSPGEQQRVAIARLFVHKPLFALMDEATTAIPQVLEAEVFRGLSERGITCVTIAHNQALRSLHKYSLDLDGNGSYSFYQNTQTTV